MKLKLLCLFIVISTMFCLPNIELKDLNSSKSITMCYSVQRECFSLLLDLDSPYTWVPSKNNPNTNIVKKLDEDSYGVNVVARDIILSYDNKKLKMIEAKTKINLAKKEISTFPILLASDSEDFGNTPGIFGLGYSYTESSKKYSMIHNLKSFKAINKKIFSMVYEKNKAGYLLIGDTPRGVDSNLLANCSFDMNMAKNGHLYCRTKSMIFGKYYFNDKRIDFDEEYNLIGFDYKIPQTIIPFELFGKISEEMFSSLIDSKECSFELNKNINLYEISCKKNDYKELKDITIVINDFGLYIPKNNLFSYHSKSKLYKFVIHSKTDAKIIRLGHELLKNYIIIFDLEEDKSSFYNTEKIIKIAKNADEEEEMIDDDKKKKKQEEEERRRQEEEEKRRKQKEEEEEKKRQEEIKNKRKKEEEEMNKINEQNKKTRSRIWTTIIIILILVVGFFIFSFIRKKKKLSKRAKLNFEKDYDELYTDIERIKY